MIKTWLSIVALAAILTLGCSQTVPTGNSVVNPAGSVTEYGQELREKAVQLATSELARLNAMELLYRNIPMKHQLQNPATLHFQTGWTKSYRRFSGFEVKDVLRSDSLLTPVIFEVEYDYEVFATQYRRMEEGSNALQETEADLVFAPLYSKVLTVKYGCDERGEVVNQDGNYLPRPNYYQVDELNEVVVGPKPAGFQP